MTYAAYVIFANGKKDKRWTGLTRGQAKWRYHWIKRNWYSEFGDAVIYGWEKE